MTTITVGDIQDLLAALDADDRKERVTAIQLLGEIGDENALEALRERLATVNQEMFSLIVAVGKLKRKLGVK